MAYPNPEIYGAPETWHDCYYGGGSTQPWAALLHGEKAKVPEWSDSTGTWTFQRTQFRAAVEDGKLNPTIPVDNSICAIGQGRMSPFRKFKVFACKETAEHPNGEVLQIGQAFVGSSYNDNDKVVNTFWYEANSNGTYGIMGNGAFSRGRLLLNEPNGVQQGLDDRIWSPSGTNTHNSNRQNGNFYISPFLAYGTRTFVLQILVYVLNADYDENFNPESGSQSGAWRTLDQWKNSYSTKPIIACLLAPRVLSTYNSTTGNMGYFRINFESSQYRKIASGILDEIKFELDDGTAVPDLTDYALFSANSNSDIGVALFNDASGMHKWTNSLKVIQLVPDYISSWAKTGTSKVVTYVPYSDEVYEWIMNSTACFGMAFTPAKSTGTDASNCQFNQDFLDADLCLPVISDVDGVGVLQGNYTRGANNVNNDFINLESIFDWQPTHHDIVHDNPDGTEYFNQFSNAYNNALSNLNNNYRIRLEILTDEETAIGEITKDLSLTATGQITINYEQITRRSCSLSLINVDNKYIPTKDSPFWLNRKFKLWLGLVVGKDTYWWSQGIFYTVSANATGRILSIEGVDKGGALDGTLKLNMTEVQYKFGRGKKITELIKQTLALDVGNPYGAHNSPIGFGGNRPIDSQSPLVGIEYYGFTTVADISIDANLYISEMFTQMAELYAADCYYNTNGNLVFEPHIDSTGYKYVPTQWEFTDLSSTFEDVNYEYSFEGENVVTVYTNTTEAGVRNVAWTAYNTNPLSPLNVATGIRRASHIEIPYYNHIDEVALAQAQADLKEIETEMKTKGVDATVTVYGNIDCNNRQIIYWDEANLERFEEAYESWGYTAEELTGTISTVMGASSEYDGVEIAYSPILQTNEGAVLLDATTVDEYIWGLIDNAGSGWNKDALLNLDRTGLEFDGVLIKDLIADVGTTAIKTGEAMHYVGKYGALQLAKDEIYAIQNANEAQQIKDCRSTANHYLLANSMLGMTLNFNAPIIPHMDVNKTIDITDQYADIENGIYVVQSISIPLSSDKMQISATNINWLPNDMTFGGVSEIVQSNNTQSGGAGT